MCEKTCCICKEPLAQRAKNPNWLLGNNPWPVVDDPKDEARACDRCNDMMVVPQRLADMLRRQNSH